MIPAVIPNALLRRGTAVMISDGVPKRLRALIFQHLAGLLDDIQLDAAIAALAREEGAAVLVKNIGAQKETP